MIKKTTSLILTLAIALSGCSSIQVKGRPLFQDENELRNFLSYLDKGKGKLTKETVRKFIPGDPEIKVAKDGSEEWTYSPSYTAKSIKFGLTKVTRTNEESNDELKLYFNSQSILQDFTLNSKLAQKTIEKSKYLYEIGPAFYGAFLGILGAILLGVLR